ncbi:hypothetical protein [Streptomyces natalensis]|uniref:Uncharacterized protein n=1 Tax=Streptomyces natalensis ATCC 27448 TaxID=1240678 RepID=A0A0D7CTE3_9ACTN|nr:hypothetical protein [Streptomyces natalensis]KIZ19125.1 hypothetical protein SNA_04170 [Streptomyces natalensis ATCC 27448]
MAAQQAQPVGGVVGPDDAAHGLVGADAGAAPVDPAGGGEAAGGLPGFRGPCEGFAVGGLGVGGAVREGGDIGGAQAGAVEVTGRVAPRPLSSTCAPPRSVR